MSIYEVVNFHQLKWLGHVLQLTNHRQPRWAMSSGVGVDSKKARVGQTVTRHQSVKSLTVELSQDYLVGVAING